jgi:hypothetical protein
VTKDNEQNPSWEKPALIAAFAGASSVLNAIALPYVKQNGLKSVADFFGGDILKTTPGRFAMMDLLFVVISFHTWAFAEAKRLGILRWWAASFAVTWTVGISAAIPFFLIARNRAAG